jgi:hypothetical protein
MTYPGAGRGDAQRRGRRCSAGHTRAGGTAALRAWCPRITLLAKGGQIRITRASNRGSQGESTSTSNQTITHHTSLTSLLRVAAALMAGGEHLSKLLVTGARTVLRGNETPSHPKLAKGGGRREDGSAHGAAGQWTRERFGQLKTGRLRSLAVNKPGRTGEETGAWCDAHEGRAEPEWGSPVAASGGKPSKAASHRLSGRGQTTIPQRQRRKHSSLSGQVNGGQGDTLTPQRWP